MTLRKFGAMTALFGVIISLLIGAWGEENKANRAAQALEECFVCTVINGEDIQEVRHCLGDLPSPASGGT